MKSNFKIIATIALIATSYSLFATITPPPTPQNIPLDGSILILLSAAAGYAANKMNFNKTKSNTSNS
jgi:hypothetical protein